MICILAGNRQEAERFASSQEWERSEWFCPLSTKDISQRKNFHTLVIGSYWELPVKYFAEDMYRLAKIYGYKK